MTATINRIQPKKDSNRESRNHSWDPEKTKKILACDSPDGNERTERTCKNCDLVKITIHYPHGFPGREWRHPSGGKIALSRTPPCVEPVP